ncbi:MAG TPA: TetR/AcrR family transcriptional regulator [Nocardioides sp.]|nr:TetR/AcrR family transcriptional regulator [Nocardioides sp.]
MSDVFPPRRAARWDEHNANRKELIVDAAIEAIQAAPEGSEPKVQEIAERAGLVRTVVYRHFNGREELNRTVQRRLVEQMYDAITAGLSLEGTIPEIITRTTAAYVNWVADNPKLYLAATRDLGDGKPSEAAQGIDQLASRVMSVISFAAGIISSDVVIDAKLLEPMVYGVISQARGMVEHWTRTPAGALSQDIVILTLSRSIWFQIQGFAGDLGIPLAPDVQLRDLFGPPDAYLNASAEPEEA